MYEINANGFIEVGKKEKILTDEEIKQKEEKIIYDNKIFAYMYSEFNPVLCVKRKLARDLLIKYDGELCSHNIYYNDNIENELEDGTIVTQYRTLIDISTSQSSHSALFLTYLVKINETGELFYPILNDNKLDLWIQYILKDDMSEKIKDPFKSNDQNNKIKLSRTVYFEELQTEPNMRQWVKHHHIEQSHNKSLKPPSCNCCNGTRKKEEDISSDELINSMHTCITVSYENIELTMSKDSINVQYKPYYSDIASMQYNISTNTYEPTRYNSCDFNSFSYNLSDDSMRIHTNDSWLFAHDILRSSEITIHRGKYFMKSLLTDLQNESSFYDKELITLKYPNFITDDTLWSRSNSFGTNNSYLENLDKSKEEQIHRINMTYINDVKIYNDDKYIPLIMNSLKTIHTKIYSNDKLTETNKLKFNELINLKDIHHEIEKSLELIEQTDEFKQIVNIVKNYSNQSEQSKNKLDELTQKMYDIYSTNPTKIDHIILKKQYNGYKLTTNIDGYIVIYVCPKKEFLIDMAKKWLPDREVVELEDVKYCGDQSVELSEDKITTIEIKRSNLINKQQKNKESS
jgi:hypothetical protein